MTKQQGKYINLLTFGLFGAQVTFFFLIIFVYKNNTNDYLNIFVSKNLWTNIQIYLYQKTIQTNIWIYLYQKNDTIMIRRNICIKKYSNIFKYPNIRHTLVWILLEFHLPPFWYLFLLLPYILVGNLTVNSLLSFLF